jgi:hypothetical protein
VKKFQYTPTAVKDPVGGLFENKSANRFFFPLSGFATADREKYFFGGLLENK